MPVSGEVTERIGAAVHRSRALSREGMAERLFGLAFRGLVYAQIWEDPAVDMAALDLSPDDEIVCIASGSCNLMSYLAARPRSILAADLSPAHVALGRLKLAAARHLPGHAEFRRFFADAADRRNVEDYDRYLRHRLDEDTRAFWDMRGPLGKRRIEMFARGLYRHGALGRFIGFGHGLARLLGVDVRRLLECRTIEEQRAFFDAQIAPLFDSRLVRLLASNRASLTGLGIPPAQYRALAESAGGDIVAALRQRTGTLACGFPLTENYFAWQAFGRAYAPDGPVPPYLEPGNFDAVREGAAHVTIVNDNLVSVLERLPARSKQAFVLLDAQDWMTDAQLNALWSALTRVAAPGARVIFRTAAEPTLLPGRVDDRILGQWHYDEQRCRQWTASDRSAIYGGFHLYGLRA